MRIAELHVSKHHSAPTETAQIACLADLTRSHNRVRSEPSCRNTRAQHADPAATADGHRRRSDVLANTVAVVNPKGGVGKTSITANVAGVMAASRWTVLAVDLDPQGNLGQDLGYVDHADNDRGASSQELFTAPTSDRLRILRGVRERLDVVCGGEKIGVTAQTLEHSDSVVDGHTLTRALASVADRYNLIPMDCPSQVGGVSLLALAAARGVVVPIRGDDCSIAGLDLAADSASACATN